MLIVLSENMYICTALAASCGRPMQMMSKTMCQRLFLYLLLLPCCIWQAAAQLNTERITYIGRNALYFEDYVLAIQYFNRVIQVKPYLADPYFYRSVAKLSLEDFRGAEEDATEAIERNPFIVDAYQVRGRARQNTGNYQGAIDDYAAGLRYAPENKQMLLNKAIAEVQSEQYTQADSSFSRLVAMHPSYYNAYVSRGQYRIMRGDTLAALADLDKAIEVDKYRAQAYAQRGILTAIYKHDYDAALDDIDKALRLEPNTPSYYINRALIRYYREDLRGAMDDYDKVLRLEPTNLIARYNRGLLSLTVGAKNDALADFNYYLQREPDNLIARYNRAILLSDLGEYRSAVGDFDAVLEAYPDFYQGFYARSEAKRLSGDMAGGKKDYERAMTLYEESKKRRSDVVRNDDGTEDDTEKVRKESDRNINKFDRLLVADNTAGVEQQYASEIRGRIQDRVQKVEIFPLFTLTYYEKSDAVRRGVFYVPELAELNHTRLFGKRLLLSNTTQPLDSLQALSHFNSVSDYSRLIGINPSNPVPYFGRAIDFMLLQDFDNALVDLDHVVALSPDFMFAYFLRAYVRYKQIDYRLSTTDTESRASYSISSTPGVMTQPSKLSDLGLVREPSNVEYEMVLHDYDMAIALAPDFAYNYYNRANVRCSRQDFKAAVADYTAAIERNPDFAEAYYNRGLVYIYLGQNDEGIADLSKAGELGVVSAYNIIKRLSD